VRRIRWTTEAYAEFESAIQHIQRDNPATAARVATAVCDGIERLVAFPAPGRPGEVAGTRELVVAPYVVVYKVRDEVVEILHVWHGAQDWR
jgi:addiction module RelE/StbE family toxin